MPVNGFVGALTHPSPRLPEWIDVLLEEGLASDAISLLERALAARPTDPELRIALVQALSSSNDLDRVLQETEKALPLVQADPIRGWLLALRALTLNMLGKTAEGLTSAQEAARLAPTEQLPLFALAMLLSSNGQARQAQDVAQSILDLDEEAPYGHVAMAAVSDDEQQTELHLRRAAEIAPDDEQLVTLLGGMLLERGKNREALDLLSHAAGAHPDSLEAPTSRPSSRRQGGGVGTRRRLRLHVPLIRRSAARARTVRRADGVADDGPRRRWSYRTPGP